MYLCSQYNNYIAMTLLLGLLIPLLGTMLGSAFVFFMKDDLPERVQKTLLGFASGVMVAASVWSLLGGQGGLVGAPRCRRVPVGYPVPVGAR